MRKLIDYSNFKTLLREGNIAECDILTIVFALLQTFNYTGSIYFISKVSALGILDFFANRLSFYCPTLGVDC